jgi:hypothetical protein
MVADRVALYATTRKCRIGQPARAAASRVTVRVQCRRHESGPSGDHRAIDRAELRAAKRAAVQRLSRVGKLLDLVQLFDDAPEVNLRAFSVLDSSDHAVVRLIFDNADAARHLMRRRQMAFSETDLLIVELSKNLSLTHICLFLLGAELNIRFAYPVMMAADDHPTIAIAVDDNTLAGQILRRKGFRLLGEEDLG